MSRILSLCLLNTFVLVDSKDETVLMRAAKQPDENFFKLLVNVTEKLFCKEEIIEMLSQSNTEGKTAFHFSIENRDEEIFETVRDFYIKTLGNEAMKNLILAEVDWTNVFTIFNLGAEIKRLVPLLKSLCIEVGVHLKNIFSKPYGGRTLQKAMKSHLKHSNASITSYLDEQFQDDEQIKMFIIELES